MSMLTTGFLTGLLLTLSVANASSERYHPNHLFIKMKDGQSLVKSPLIKSSKKIIPGLYLVKTTSADALATTLQDKAAIEYVQRDFYSGKSAMPKLEPLDLNQLKMKAFTEINLNQFNDPDVSKLWAFDTTGLDVSGAYASLPGHTPKEIIVAVADTGVDHKHEDLKDVMWTNDGEIPADGKDNDGNGYIDDIHGINVLVRDAQGRATMDTMASHWHGTHVSGTIAATQNNAVGIAGVASNVKIMAIRVVPDDSDELDSDIVEGFKYAAVMGAKVINCSFGKKNNEGGMVVRDVMNEIGTKYGVLVVVSAGNDSQAPFFYSNNDVDMKYPASYDSENMLVIASTTSSGSLSSFSNVGKVTVDVASPGSNIYSTVNGGKYAMASGTSMAAPNASGVAAMVLGYYPELSVKELKQVLTSTVTKVPAFTERMSSGGRLNLKRALEVAAQ
ncbi:MAG TPA: S8 family peptidase [Bacteriovoracaceae bacterium]|nr:S8 family peptidase [Bacteriovoracaceae bacterium]